MKGSMGIGNPRIPIKIASISSLSMNCRMLGALRGLLIWVLSKLVGPPPSQWCKLNTDGASRGNPGCVNCADVIRNNVGVVDLLRNIPERHLTLARPLKRIRAMMNRDWKVTMHHTFIEANRVVDALANLILDADFNCWIQDSPSHAVSLDLFADCNGVNFPGLI
ncbi:hypothetical protein PIB30_071679 [Stylosanthes scabra]|uniref:RNase H type-1 domain-containing protein n=1 Tax=Stylosanthes scabra TaxID=79078 RepID=A0ABU6VNI3_9FABA|nr:hypothetical protein [Stylosanthes scabra]